MKALRDGHHGDTPAVGILALREAVAADLDNRFPVGLARRSQDPPGGKPTMFMAILMFGQPASISFIRSGLPIYRSMIEFPARRQSRCRSEENNSPSRPRKRSN